MTDWLVKSKRIFKEYKNRRYKKYLLSLGWDRVPKEGISCSQGWYPEPSGGGTVVGYWMEESHCGAALVELLEICPPELAGNWSFRVLD